MEYGRRGEAVAAAAAAAAAGLRGCVAGMSRWERPCLEKCVSLSVCLSVCLSVSVCVSVSLCLCVYLRLCLRLCLCAHACLYSGPWLSEMERNTRERGRGRERKC